jgi:hypothetical protein
LYKTYILPIIEYCNIFWVPNGSQIDKIESIQRCVTKFVCFKKGRMVCYEQRLKELELKPLQVRRELSIIKIVYKCTNNHYDIPLM